MNPGLRVVLTVLALPFSCVAGTCLAMPVVGAPHAFLGLLLDAPEPVRMAVAFPIYMGMLILTLWLIWRRPNGKRAGETSPPRAP
jgi:hypothetical protein